MTKKTEYRADEYREYENGKWGPWRKGDGRLFDGDVISDDGGPEEYRVYEEWRFGIIESKDAWAKLKKLRGIYYKWANDTELNKPDRRFIAAAFQTKCEKIEIYLKEIGEKIIQEQHKKEVADKETAPDAQTPERGETVAPKSDPIKQTLQWLKKKQLVIHHTVPEKPIITNGAISDYEPPKSERRITKTVALVCRELVSAAKTNEIPLTESEVSDFMINYLKSKGGKEITKNAIDKAKSRQKPPKSA